MPGPTASDPHQPSNTEALEAEIRRLREELEIRQNTIQNSTGQALTNTEILESINDAFYALDADFNFSFTNSKALEWWGKSGENLIGINFWQAFPAARGTHSGKMHLQALAENRVMRYETFSPVLDHWIDVSIYPDRSGGLSVYFRDISERKAAEDALRASETKFRNLFDSIGEAIATIEPVYDTDGKPCDCILLDHNPAFGRIMGIADAGGRPASELFAAAGDCWTDMLGRILSLKPGERFERYFEPRDLWLDVYATPIGDSPGRQLGVVMNDITERKRAAARNDFVIKLSDAINPLGATEPILQAAARTLGGELGVQWVICGEAVSVDGVPHFKPSCHYTADLNIPMGPFAAQDFGQAIAALRQGQSLIFDDIAVSLPEAEHRALQALGVRAMAVVPFIKGGELLFSFGAYHPEPFHWTPELVDLIEVTAERTWAALERARTETELRESATQLRITMESATDYAIISTDIRGIINGWSAGAELIFGYSAQEAIGLSANLIFTPEDVANGAPEREMANARNLGWGADERWHLRRDGSRFYMSGVMRPIFNPELHGYVKVARDMTEYQEAADRLRVSEERHRIALSSAGMGAWDWSVDSNEIIWNEQHFLLLGMEPEDRVLSVEEFLRHVHAEDREFLGETLYTALNGSGTYNSEFRIRRQDNGAIRWMHGYGKVIEYLDGRPVRMVGVMFDVTESKALEQQKDQFISIASHELRTPVSALKAYSEVLLDVLAENGDSQSHLLMQKLDGQIDRLGDLIRTLLDVTRLRKGLLEMQFERFELGALLRDVQEEISYPDAGRIQLQLDGTALVNGERLRIRQVLNNLISNALRFSPTETPIILRMFKGNGMVHVSVRDFGPGIAPELHESVLERFYRGSDEQASTFPGLGLGLFIAAEIINLHGGSIAIHSPQGAGADVVFSLPVISQNDDVK